MKTITSKKRFLKALNHQKADRPAFNFWMDRPLMQRYEKEIGHRHWRATHFGADVIETFPLINFTGEIADITSWGAFSKIKSWDELDNISIPDPDDPKIYELIKKDLNEFPDHAVILDMITPWGHIASVRSYEKIYMDMYDEPERFHALSGKITDLLKIVTERACKMGVTALYLMEDLADRNGLTISPSMINQFVLPYANELAEIARKYNVPVMFHSDGNVNDLLDHLIKIGVCAVNPMQPHLNDATEFKNKYGDKLAVYGGLDNCYIIPDGTPEEVREHVLDVFNDLGKSDGALIFSTHDIPEYTPKENIEALISTIKNECFY